MGKHIDTRPPRRVRSTDHDSLARRRRATFKQYLQDQEDELLEDELIKADDTQDPADEPES